jgi:hypothetical protein
VAIDNWEAAVYTRAPQVSADGGFRLGRLEFDPATGGEPLVKMFQETGLPKLQAIDGFAGATLFLDRAAGRASVGVLYRDRAALAASRGPQSAVRGESLGQVQVTLRSMEEFDVVLLERKDT